ncbi:MAG: hypothetical protein ABI604_11090 [Nitrospirota bacterium]
MVTEDQIIVAAEVTQEENDIKQWHPMLEQAPANLKAIAYPQAVGTALAAAGYCSEANLTAADPAGPEWLIATNKDWKQRKALRAPRPRRTAVWLGSRKEDRGMILSKATRPHGLSKKRLGVAHLEARAGYQTARSRV